ncbi:glycosyltransferase family 2 protein [Fusobacterium varium]|uniref:glycosyltransferase family 2 protein n=1 Tax=Fusobacterium varium TaxID=856 RepID=UPI00242A449F|nr:glycosyltransferase family 2 protein [Fusobacterium varium]MCF0170581.1 glycosyltransferase family 2 protein [Fusobacterium varium]
MDVSVIIINYNTLQLTENTINSVIEKTKDIKYEIILVDNASIDGSIEYFEEKYKNKIIFLKNRENLGFGRANNRGIEIAKGKYIFLLNSDTLLINNAIKILFNYMELNSKVGVCGGNLYNENFLPEWSYCEKMMGYNSEYLDHIINIFRIRILKIKNFYFNTKNKPKQVEIIIGADMFIRKEILKKVGKFDEDFFMYHEESELCFRVLKNGYDIYSVPEARIIHLGGKSNKFKKEQFKMERFGKYMFFYKTKGKKSLKLVYLLSQMRFLNKLDIEKFRLNKGEYEKFKLFLREKEGR